MFAIPLSAPLLSRFGLLCLAACALAGCGGGNSSAKAALEVNPETPAASVGVSGQIYPAVPGVVMVEYGADGAELQRSAPSSADGSFELKQPLSGARVESLYSPTSERVSAVYAAHLNPIPLSSAKIEVTPLTTWYDQLVENGTPAADAAQYIVDVVDQNCTGQETSVLTKAHLQPYSSIPKANHDWLLSATSAYLQAARSLGLGPKVDFAGWAAALDRHTAMLSRLCSLSAQMSSAEWISAQSRKLQSENGIATPDRVRLSAAISGARAQALSAVARQTPLAEYPEQTALLQASNNIEGRELLLASDYVITQYLLGQSSNATPQALTDGATSTNLAITAAGSLVHTMQASIPVEGTSPTSMRLVNSGSKDARIRLTINNQYLADLPNIIEQIIAMPGAFPEEPLYRKAWRYVMAHKRNTTPLFVGMFQQQPDLWLRSVGSSYCDAQAAVLQWIWRGMGYQARVYGLTGHVTTEILVDGHWEIFDPYLEVFYTDRTGQIVGVAELERDPTLVTNPADPQRPLSDIAYSTTVAEIFGTPLDNFIHQGYMETLPQPLSNVFQIPAGGRLDINTDTHVTLKSLEPGYTVDMSTMQLWVPPGYTGTLPLSMLLMDVKGQGQIQLLGRSVDPTKTDTAALLQKFYFDDPTKVGVPQISIDSVGPEGLTLTLLVNPLYFQDSELLTVRVSGDDITGLGLNAVPPRVQ